MPVHFAQRLACIFLVFVLKYEMESNRKGCIYRDNYSVNNTITIAEQYLKDITSPSYFRRNKEPKNDATLKNQ